VYRGRKATEIGFENSGVTAVPHDEKGDNISQDKTRLLNH
jgi:hypothetical protein